MVVPRRIVAIVAAISVFPCADVVTSASAQTPQQKTLERRVSTSAQLERQRLIVSLVDRQVAIKLVSGETMRGSVREIRGDRFLLRVDPTRTSSEIAFRDVQEAAAGQEKRKRIILAVVIAAGLAAITAFGLKKAHRWPDGTPGV
jgi:hypothetical protein